VITGGGIGSGAAPLTALGADVAIVGRNADKLDAVQAEIHSDGGRVSIHTADIRDEAAVSDVIDAILTEHGRIDGLFNNAGGQYRAALETISTKGFEAVVRNNLTGGFVVMREVYTKWMQAHGGAIVNMIADIWHGWPHFAHSAAARGGMLTLSESAATEWAAAGVRVNTIAPGSIASSGLDTYDSNNADFIRNEVAREIPCSALEPRRRSPRLWCSSSPAASFITGTCIRRWSAERQAGVVGTATGAEQQPVRRIPPLSAARHPRPQPTELVATIQKEGSTYDGKGAL
jgi:citronellol/citronellal dehydrogenase